MHTKKTVMIKTIETRDGEVSTGRHRRVAGRQGTRTAPVPALGAVGWHGVASHSASLPQVVSEATQQQHEVL